jgi:hypothetical protein
VDIKTDLTALSIDNLTASWTNRTIAANPEYQRGLAWNDLQQKLLIDSIFRGYPLPRFYFHVRRARGPLGDTEHLEVIDGQQRIIAMARFREDHFTLFDPKKDKVPLPKAVRNLPCPWGGKTFSQLSESLQRQFLVTPLSVIIIEEESTSEEVRDLFIRLQSGTALTRQQVRDAWPGNIGPYVESLAGKLQRRPRFSLFAAVDKRGERQDEDLRDEYLPDRQTCAQLLTLFLARQQTFTAIPSVSTNYLDALYHQYTDFDPNGEDAATFEQLLEWCDHVLEERPRTSGGRKEKVRKNRLFSLFLLLHDLNEAPSIRVDRELAKIARRTWSETAKDSEPVGRVVSGKTIAEHYWWLIHEKLAGLQFTGLDPKRLFDEHQKKEIWARDGGICPVCSAPITEGTEEYDHVRPWILGGETTASNGRAVHKECHERGPLVGQLKPT